MALVDIERVRLLIPQLDELRFAGLCNSLLSELAVQNGIALSCLRLNLNTKEPDGGIDAACIDAPSLVPRIIPRPFTDYQFKSGRSPRALATIAEQDVLGQPRVVNGLRAGHAFVYMAGWDRGDSIEEEIIARLGEKQLVVQRDQIVFIGREMLAQLLVDSPALVAKYLGLELTANLFEMSQWSGWRTMSNPYIKDDALLARVAELRKRIEAPGAIVRLVGAAGDGKTRMVLEALRDSTIASTVLYAAQADAVSGGLIHHLTQTPSVRCTLVVDEVDDATAYDIENRLHARPPGVRVVLIGLDATGRPQPETLQVEGLSNDLLVAVIRSIAAGIGDDIAREIAEDCERSPKLAVLIAGCIRDDPRLVRSTVLTDRRVQSALERYLPIERSEPAWRALAATALLMRLGWFGDAENESSLLFGLLGLELIRARQDVDVLHERFGIAPIAGRFRYVSPAILGDHLCAGELRAWTRDHMTFVFRALTPAMADSFARRARRLSAILDNAAVVEEVILGGQGPFRSLAEVENDGTAFILRHLAAAFPKATLTAIHRIVATATLEELSAATASRRDLYWALEELLWPAETFEGASTLLLRLAIAENETWANNASNTWVETFQMVLGRTAAGWETRVRVLRAAASHEDARARILAARAVQAAFKTGTISRSGNPPRDVPGMPDREWRPATYGEWADALVAYLETLEPLVEDAEPQVRKAAAHTLGSASRELFHLMDRVVEQWQRIVLRLKDAEYDLRAEVLKPIEWSMGRWTDQLATLEASESPEDREDEASKDDQRSIIGARLRVLREVEDALDDGRDFSTQFRRAVTKPYRSASRRSREDGEATVRAELRELANAVITKPSLMEEQWEWLLHDKEWRGAERWVEILGAEDRQRTFQQSIERLAAESPRGALWLSLYDLSFAVATNNPNFLDERVEEFANKSWYSQAVDLLSRAGYTSKRFARLREMFAAGKIPAGALNQFAFGSWGTISAEEARSLIDAALAQSEQPAELVPFVSSYLSAFPDAAATLRDTALSVLTSAATAPPEVVDSYQWSELAQRFVRSDASTIVDLVLRQVAEHAASHDGALIEALQSAWNASDKQSLFAQVVAKWLERDYVGGFWVRSALESIAIEEAGDEFLLQWVREDPEKRAYVLAEVVGPPRNPVTPLQANLLAEFGDRGVGAAFRSTFMSGTFVGTHSQWARSKLAQARAWASDNREAVSRWATELSVALEDDVRKAEAREAEERFFR